MYQKIISNSECYQVIKHQYDSSRNGDKGPYLKYIFVGKMDKMWELLGIEGTGGEEVKDNFNILGPVEQQCK